MQTPAIACYPQAELPWNDSGEARWRFRFIVLAALSSVLLAGSWFTLLPAPEQPPLTPAPKPVPVVVQWLDMNLDPVKPVPPVVMEQPKHKASEFEPPQVDEPKPEIESESKLESMTEPKVEQLNLPPTTAKSHTSASPKPSPQQARAVTRSHNSQTAATAKQRASQRFSDIFGGGASARRSLDGALMATTNRNLPSGSANVSAADEEWDQKQLGQTVGLQQKEAGHRSVHVDTSVLNGELASQVSVTSALRQAKVSENKAPGGSAQALGQRSRSNIQQVFNRHKRSFDRLYARALRSSPGLQGEVVFRLTISAAGAVTAASLVSSNLGNPTLERKLLVKVRQLNFGAKNVQVTTVTYPIQFYPV
ncbi:MAG: TonB family protein [bacterium]